jgi:hypothetical protein
MGDSSFTKSLTSFGRLYLTLSLLLENPLLLWNWIVPSKTFLSDRSGALEKFYDNHALSIINLEKETVYHLAHCMNAINKVDNSVFQDTDYNSALKVILPKIQDRYALELAKNYEMYGEFKLSALNKQLDKARTDVKILIDEQILLGITPEKINALHEKLTTAHSTDGQNPTPEAIESALKAKLKEAFRTTLAFPEGFIVEQEEKTNTGLITQTITNPTHSAHDLNPLKSTITKLTIDAKTLYRSDILVPDKKSVLAQKEAINSKFTDLTENLFKEEDILSGEDLLYNLQTKATVVKLIEFAQSHKENPATTEFYYNLLTSVHGFNPLSSGIGQEDKNQQTERAMVMMDVQDTYNFWAIKTGYPLLFTLHIPTNGFGETISANQYDIGGVTATVNKIAERNDLALAMLLGSEEQKKALRTQYVSFIKSSETSFPEDLKEIIEDTKNLMRKDLDPLKPHTNRNTELKDILAFIYVNNLHYEKDYAKITQVLALALEEQAIYGCKSGHERTASIQGRLEELLKLGNDYGVKHPINETQVSKFARIIDEAYRDHNQYGFSTDIALNGQGGVSKIQTASIFNPRSFFDSNYAEGSLMTTTQNAHASAWQGHKQKQLIANVTNKFRDEITKFREQESKKDEEKSLLSDDRTSEGHII